MSHIGSVTQLLQQIRAGEEAALGKLAERYWPFLLARAGERLPVALRRDANEEDVAQQVLWLFCRGFEDGRWQRLANRQDLVALLNTITERQAINQLKKALRQKRGGGRHPEPLPGDGGSTSDAGPVLADPEPPPQEQVLQDDWCRHCLDRLPDDLRRLAELLIAGWEQKDIAAELGCSQRTVVRKVSLLRGCWVKLMAERETNPTVP
jgi:DNA-directed RNA polymerase specialized sigma24 family protein